MADNTLILVRHAKSSWSNPGLSDHERPLNKRGKRDAPRMGRRLAGLGYHPQLLASSSAVRALTTAELIAAEIDYESRLIEIEGQLYGAAPGEILNFPKHQALALQHRDRDDRFFLVLQRDDVAFDRQRCAALAAGSLDFLVLNRRRQQDRECREECHREPPPKGS